MAYDEIMIDVMSVLKEKRSKTEAKVARAAKVLETAKKELDDVIAAERVMAEITGESIDSGDAVQSVSERDREITKLLGVGEEEARSPLELHAAYAECTGDQINLDAFRTALWRLQKKAIRGENKVWSVKSVNGRYWRAAIEEAADEIASLIGGS